MSHIRSSEYRKCLANVLRLHDNLPTLVQIRDNENNRREKRVMYRLTFNAVKGVMLEGFIIDPETHSGQLSVISAEEAFVQNRGFWVGSPSHIYKDFATEKDKKNKLVWAATYEREATFVEFAIDESEPLVTIQYSRTQLERIADEATEPKGNVYNSSQADRVAEGVRNGSLAPTFGKEVTDNVGGNTSSSFSVNAKT